MEFAVNFAKKVNPNISDEAIAIILKGVSIRKFKKGEIILGENNLPTDYYFVKSGVVRSYVKDENGTIHIKAFYVNNQLFSPTLSLIDQQTNHDIFDCLEDSEILVFDFNEFKKNALTNIELANNYIKILELAITFREKRINDLITLDATERYLKLREDYPGIESLVAQYHIASYLNMTPVQLSRIRKKIFSE